MRKIITALSLALLLVGLVLVAAGCGGGNAAANDATNQTSDAAVTNAGAVPTLTITDQAGRQVVIPAEIKTVFCTSPMGTNLMYMLAPEMMAGWNVTPTAVEKAYIPEQYRDYVGLGGWFGKGTTGNVEEIIKRAPSIVLSVGSHDASAVSEADRVQGLLNIPVVVVSGSLEESGPALRYIGTLLGLEARAEELATYCDDVIAEAKANAAKLTDAQKARVYYAEGMEGLNTDAAGSEHTEVLELVGGLNVAVVSEQSDYGMAPVSLEQVLSWDPGVILVASDKDQESTAYQQLATGDQWKSVTAVKNGKVYQIPRGPFDWFDRPASISRILGVRWLGNLLYPDLYQYDMATEVTKFYKLFYHIDLTQTQLDTLLSHATAASAK
jgi:iron complex transport system substrate-binding protein